MLICEKCGRETVKLTRVEGQAGWLGNCCVRVHSREGALLNVKYCDGNPGLGPISTVEARRDDNWTLGIEKDGKGTIQVPYQEKRAVHFVMRGAAPWVGNRG